MIDQLVSSPTAVQLPPEISKLEFSVNPSVSNHDAGETTIKIDKKEVALETPEFKQEIIDNKEVKPEKKQEEVKQENKTSILKAPKEDKVEPKLEEKKIVASTEKKEVIKPITPVKETKAEADQFDYTKYAPQEVTNLKNMSRQSREAYAKLLDENRQLSSLKDSLYLQHEQAYTLTPEYQELTTKQRYAEAEANAWRQQLLNVRAGKPFRPLTGIDSKTGQFVYGAEQPANENAEIELNQNMLMASQAAQQFNSQLGNYPGQYKQKLGNDLAAIQNEQSARFSWVADPKLLEHSVEVEGVGEVKLKDIKAQFKSLFPGYLSSHPSTDVASNLFVALQVQGAELREARRNQQVNNIQATETARAEPTSDAVESIVDIGNLPAGLPKTFSAINMPK